MSFVVCLFVFKRKGQELSIVLRSLFRLPHPSAVFMPLIQGLMVWVSDVFIIRILPLNVRAAQVRDATRGLESFLLPPSLHSMGLQEGPRAVRTQFGGSFF